MSRTSMVLLAAAAAAACASPGISTTSTPVPSGASMAAGAITAEELRRDLTAFSADSMRGRETGTPDELRAARFIATRLAQLGVTPGGDSGYYQRVPLTSMRIAKHSSVTVATPGGVSTLRIGGDIVPLTVMGVGAQNPKLNADADLVFASYGIAGDKTIKRDDYAGLEMAGKAVVVVNDAPPGADSSAVARYSGQVGFQMRLARLVSSPARPAAIIVVMTGDKGDEFFTQASAALLRTVSARDTSRMIPDAERLFPLILIARVRPGTPLLPDDWPTNDQSRALAGRRLIAQVHVSREQITGYNVVGKVPGATHPGSYVAYGAHLDHVGIGEMVNGDSIYNGADDDGSGSMAVLALARAYAQGPRVGRSVLFVWHAGEEKGLLGSEWFTAHPTVPLDSIVAQLNADMIGRNHADSLYIVGPAAAPKGQSRLLGGVVDSVNKSATRPFHFNREWDSPTHPEQIYFRSDHYMYARKGVPIVFFTTGLHADYHKPSDDVAKIDFEKMVRVAELMRRAGWAVANRDAPLK